MTLDEYLRDLHDDHLIALHQGLTVVAVERYPAADRQAWAAATFALIVRAAVEDVAAGRLRADLDAIPGR